MTNYPVADFLIRLKNASRAGVDKIDFKSTKMVVAVADAMKRAGFVESIENKNGMITAKLAIYKKNYILSDLKIVSKPGLRIYINADNLEKRRSPEILIVSTPKGILTDREAIKERLGGEVIAKVL